MSPKQRDVLMVLASRGFEPMSLDDIKARLGSGHGATQALYALVRQGKVLQLDDGTFRRR